MQYASVSCLSFDSLLHDCLCKCGKASRKNPQYVLFISFFFSVRSMKAVPVNYGMIEPMLHRCSEPKLQHFPFLRTLQLRTCVVLVDDPSPIFLTWLRENNIRTETPLVGNDDCFGGVRGGGVLSEQVVTYIVDLMLRQSNLPLLVTCAMGRYRTGVVVGCFRKVQRWSLTIILEEYRRFAGGSTKARQEDEEFLETFDTELVHIPLSAAGKRLPPLYICD